MLNRTTDKLVDYATRVIIVLLVKKLHVQVVHINPMMVTVFANHAQLVTIAVIQMAPLSHSNVLISIIALKELKLQPFAQMATMHPVSWLVWRQLPSVPLVQQVSTVKRVLWIRPSDVMRDISVMHVLLQQIRLKTSALLVIIVSKELCCQNHVKMATTL